jgi:hypothetical protein
MNSTVDLKALERQAWTSHFRDGLWDIFIGLMMLIGGIRGLTDLVWLNLLILPAVLIGPVGKRYITIPRIGWVRFGSARKFRRQWITLLLIASVILSLALLIFLQSGIITTGLPLSPIVALFIVCVSALMAYALNFWRLIAYGLLYAGSELVWAAFDRPLGPLTFTIFGALVCSFGLMLLVRFIRRNPIHDEGLQHASPA